MKILLDSNVLVGMVEQSRQGSISSAIKMAHKDGVKMFLVPQVIYEFWVVATRPKQPDNGLGFTTELAAEKIAEAVSLFPLVNDTADIYTHWYELVKQHKISGKPAHDARLVAAMFAHGLDAIMTQNAKHFRRYMGKITVIIPDKYLSKGA